MSVQEHTVVREFLLNKPVLPFFLVLATMIVFFSNRNQNYLVNFCQSFVLFLLLFSIILFVIYDI